MSGSVKEMLKHKMLWAAGIALTGVILLGVQAFAQNELPTSNASPTEQPKGKAFAKPADAAAALYAAARRNDEAELLVILGPDAKEIVEWSANPEERREQRAQFADKYEQMHRLVKEPDNTVALYVGAENWPLPIPLVEFHGEWYFDTVLGRQEIRYRRIGRNEMEAIEVCHTLLDAEKEYRNDQHQYTAKFVSTGDSHDGLYWPSSDGAGKSPIGPYLAHAGANTGNAEPFHGYYYRILLQGTDGFAVLAFPAQYRSSGVMTFYLNQDGTAYEKDLGDQTATLAKEELHPDGSWKQVD
jgi:Protein of unknown function (DUF2950)